MNADSNPGVPREVTTGFCTSVGSEQQCSSTNTGEPGFGPVGNGIGIVLVVGVIVGLIMLVRRYRAAQHAVRRPSAKPGSVRRGKK